MKPTFTASQFTPTQWDTAEQKAKFANQFVRFVDSDFKATIFPKWFYNKLSNTFGHIAHFNQGGFYDTFFSTLEGRVQFMEITEGVAGLYGENGLGICGDPAFTYCDVERAVRGWCRKTGQLAKAQERLHVAREVADRAEYDRLSQKFGKVPS